MSLTDSSEPPSLRASAGSGIRNGRPSAPDETRPAAPPTFRRGASPGLAAILSLIFPGAGQLFAGATRRGLLVALPTVLLVIVIGAAVSGGMKALLANVVQPGVILGIVVVNGVFAIYHLFAIGDAWWVARRARPGSAGARSVAVVVAALVLAVGLHGLVGGLGVQAYQTDSAVLAQPDSGITIPAPSFAAATPSPGTTAAPTPTPGPAWAADGRLNLLLIGGDAGPGRYLLRTDTMILLSVDEATGRAALFGIPRNLLNVPVAPEDAGFFKTGVKATDGRFPGLLNALWVWAYQHPDFPSGGCTPSDADKCGIARGFRAITGAVQQLVGVPLDGALVVNLNGFIDLVNAVAPNGVWIQAERVYDTAYPLPDGSGDITVDISAGCHRFHGATLLEYARSRHQDSDYGRMARQQQVLVALLHQIDPIAMLPQVSHLLDVAKNNLILAIPTADIGSLASLAASVDAATVQRIGFDPPDYPEYVTAREVTRIQTAVQTVFSEQPPSPSPSHATATARPSSTPAPCGPA
jgi:polyisoprenyl-teichoic acid--peptidoglycan teichoic acid transferase